MIKFITYAVIILFLIKNCFEISNIKCIFVSYPFLHFCANMFLINVYLLKPIITTGTYCLIFPYIYILRQSIRVEFYMDPLMCLTSIYVTSVKNDNKLHFCV